LLANPTVARWASVALLCAAVAWSAAARPTAAPAQNAARGESGAAQRPRDAVNPHGATVKGFLDRVNAYIELQKKADDGLPKLGTTDEPSKVEAYQAALAARIRLARPDARPGEIFGDLAPAIREVIRKDAQQRAGKDKKAAMEEVPRRDPLRVNASYPEKTPLATVPPLILTNLPRLPEGLEYRFMGRDFVLRDVKANLIADYINDAGAPIKQ
jgi:hypothetical protein